MTGADLLPASVLKRKAVVYVRQSTQSQVMINLESQRRQYDLVEVARQHGFMHVEVIDDDMGRSASGTVARPGFDRLVGWLCTGKVGAVLCFDASRLARNGRDWHHLLELCGLVDARVIDQDGVYNPSDPNDRLLLGMKGWTAKRVSSVRRVRNIHAYLSAEKGGDWLTMSDAAKALGVTNHTIRRLIKANILPAMQVVPGAPFQIRASDLATDAVKAAIARKSSPCRASDENTLPMFADT